MNKVNKVNKDYLIALIIAIIITIVVSQPLFYSDDLCFHSDTPEGTMSDTPEGAMDCVDPVLSWDMEQIPGENIADGEENTGIKFVNIRTVKGRTGKGAYFNGIDSYIQTAYQVQGWKNFAISFWVRPEKLMKDDQLAVIMDNGHSAKNNFAFQTADFSGQKWVWHCNGTDIVFSLPLKEWSRVFIMVDTEKKQIIGYLNDIKVGEINLTQTPIFGSKPLVFGKLSSSPSRFYRGTIDNVKLWKNPLNKS
tara:strand:+ start:8816 stop:9565 length:750 start_codon:yes stop_codon:yes gene_type:complete